MASSVTGLPETVSNFHATVVGIDEAARKSLLDVAYDGAHDARRRAPRETGRLADSFTGAGLDIDSLGPGGVRTGTDKYGPFADIGSRVEYAAVIEFRDTPMLRPAAQRMEAELVDEVTAGVRRTMGRRIKRVPK